MKSLLDTQCFSFLLLNCFKHRSEQVSCISQCTVYFTAHISDLPCSFQNSLFFCFFFFNFSNDKLSVHFTTAGLTFPQVKISAIYRQEDIERQRYLSSTGLFPRWNNNWGKAWNSMWFPPLGRDGGLGLPSFVFSQALSHEPGLCIIILCKPSCWILQECMKLSHLCGKVLFYSNCFLPLPQCK